MHKRIVDTNKGLGFIIREVIKNQETSELSLLQEASVPFMITRAMRQKLAELGYSNNDIKDMTPAAAHSKIEAHRATLTRERSPAGQRAAPGEYAGPSAAGHDPEATADRAAWAKEYIRGADTEEERAKRETNYPDAYREYLRQYTRAGGERNKELGQKVASGPVHTVKQTGIEDPDELLKHQRYVSADVPNTPDQARQTAAAIAAAKVASAGGSPEEQAEAAKLAGDAAYKAAALKPTLEPKATSQAAAQAFPGTKVEQSPRDNINDLANSAIQSLLDNLIETDNPNFELSKFADPSMLHNLFEYSGMHTIAGEKIQIEKVDVLAVHKKFKELLMGGRESGPSIALAGRSGQWEEIAERKRKKFQQSDVYLRTLSGMATGEHSIATKENITEIEELKQLQSIVTEWPRKKRHTPYSFKEQYSVDRDKAIKLLNRLESLGLIKKTQLSPLAKDSSVWQLVTNDTSKIDSLIDAIKNKKYPKYDIEATSTIGINWGDNKTAYIDQFWATNAEDVLVKWGESAKQLADKFAKADEEADATENDEVNKTLEELGKVQSFDAIKHKRGTIKNYIDQFGESSAKIDADDLENIWALFFNQAMFETLQGTERENALQSWYNQPSITIDNSNIDGNAGDAIGNIDNYKINVTPFNIIMNKILQLHTIDDLGQKRDRFIQISGEFIKYLDKFCSSNTAQLKVLREYQKLRSKVAKQVRLLRGSAYNAGYEQLKQEGNELAIKLIGLSSSYGDNATTALGVLNQIRSANQLIAKHTQTNVDCQRKVDELRAHLTDKIAETDKLAIRDQIDENMVAAANANIEIGKLKKKVKEYRAIYKEYNTNYSKLQKLEKEHSKQPSSIDQQVQVDFKEALSEFVLLTNKLPPDIKILINATEAFNMPPAKVFKDGKITPFLDTIQELDLVRAIDPSAETSDEAGEFASTGRKRKTSITSDDKKRYEAKDNKILMQLAEIGDQIEELEKTVKGKQKSSIMPQLRVLQQKQRTLYAQINRGTGGRRDPAGVGGDPAQIANVVSQLRKYSAENREHALQTDKDINRARIVQRLHAATGRHGSINEFLALTGDQFTKDISHVLIPMKKGYQVTTKLRVAGLIELMKLMYDGLTIEPTADYNPLDMIMSAIGQSSKHNSADYQEFTLDKKAAQSIRVCRAGGGFAARRAAAFEKDRLHGIERTDEQGKSIAPDVELSKSTDTNADQLNISTIADLFNFLGYNKFAAVGTTARKAENYQRNGFLQDQIAYAYKARRALIKTLNELYGLGQWENAFDELGIDYKLTPPTSKELKPESDERLPIAGGVHIDPDNGAIIDPSITAQQIGLMDGDIITRIDNMYVIGVDDIKQFVYKKNDEYRRDGDKIKLVVKRESADGHSTHVNIDTTFAALQRFSKTQPEFIGPTPQAKTGEQPLRDKDGNVVLGTINDLLVESIKKRANVESQIKKLQRVLSETWNRKPNAKPERGSAFLGSDPHADPWQRAAMGDNFGKYTAEIINSPAEKWGDLKTLAGKLKQYKNDFAKITDPKILKIIDENKQKVDELSETINEKKENINLILQRTSSVDTDELMRLLKSKAEYLDKLDKLEADFNAEQDLHRQSGSNNEINIESNEEYRTLHEQLTQIDSQLRSGASITRAEINEINAIRLNLRQLMTERSNINAETKKHNQSVSANLLNYAESNPKNADHAHRTYVHYTHAKVIYDFIKPLQAKIKTLQSLLKPLSDTKPRRRAVYENDVKYLMGNADALYRQYVTDKDGEDGEEGAIIFSSLSKLQDLNASGLIQPSEIAPDPSGKRMGEVSAFGDISLRNPGHRVLSNDDIKKSVAHRVIRAAVDQLLGIVNGIMLYLSHNGVLTITGDGSASKQSRATMARGTPQPVGTGGRAHINIDQATALDELQIINPQNLMRSYLKGGANSSDLIDLGSVALTGGLAGINSIMAMPNEALAAFSKKSKKDYSKEWLSAAADAYRELIDAAKQNERGIVDKLEANDQHELMSYSVGALESAYEILRYEQGQSDSSMELLLAQSQLNFAESNRKKNINASLQKQETIDRIRAMSGDEKKNYIHNRHSNNPKYLAMSDTERDAYVSSIDLESNFAREQEKSKRVIGKFDRLIKGYKGQVAKLTATIAAENKTKNEISIKYKKLARVINIKKKGKTGGSFAENAQRGDLVYIYNVSDAPFLNGLCGYVSKASHKTLIVELFNNNVVADKSVVLKHDEVMLYYKNNLLVEYDHTWT